MKTVINKELAVKILDLLKHGLTSGVGEPQPGKMCVEAVVKYAMGLPHGDDPPCVGANPRACKIALNDSYGWASAQDRAQGLMKVAIAQLGSDTIDQQAFDDIVRREMIRLVLPIYLRVDAERFPQHSAQLEEAALKCEALPSRETAIFVDELVWYKLGLSLSMSKSTSVSQSQSVSKSMSMSVSMSKSNSVSQSQARKILSIIADIILQALIELKSPGCEFLYLCDE